MKELFLFSGLGADKRVFGLLDLREYNIHHITWPKPNRGESLKDYAKKILPQITKEKPILIGVSFGGMIALEIAKVFPVEKVIQISSATSSNAIPSYFKFIGKLKLQKLLPSKALKKPNEMLFWLFGVTAKEHKALLSSILEDTDEIFFTWALEAIAKWENKTQLPNVIQIHGTKDRILSAASANFIVKGGGHLMIVTRAQEVSNIIKMVTQSK